MMRTAFLLVVMVGALGLALVQGCDCADTAGDDDCDTCCECYCDDCSVVSFLYWKTSGDCLDCDSDCASQCSQKGCPGGSGSASDECDNGDDDTYVPAGPDSCAEVVERYRTCVLYDERGSGICGPVYEADIADLCGPNCLSDCLEQYHPDYNAVSDCILDCGS